MKIVNVLPETYLEYEDHLSIVLFSFGCNLHCRYCYNYSFVTNPNNICAESAEEIIDKLYHPLIDGLVFLGGEPTLYPERLKEIAIWAKKKYSLDIKIFTNGYNPGLIISGFREGWLDNVSIDLKTMTDNTLFIAGGNPVKKVTDLLETLVNLGYKNRVEVRTTVYKEATEEDLLNIETYCKQLGLSHIPQVEQVVWAT